MARVFVGVGSNEGDRKSHLATAGEGLDRLPGTSVAFSPVYETEPVGPVPQGRFLNAVAELQTTLSPQELLLALSSIEKAAGRPAPEERVKWGPRTLDLDILLFADTVISADDLVVPHPMMHDRWFVLKPLADLDAGAVHPLLQMTVGELLRHVEENSVGGA